MKRLFDIVASGLGLIVLSPLFLILAIWIKLDSKGPVFYRQVRVGRYNKDFRIFKFRSMRVGADKGSLVTIGGRDPRVTKSGYWIRKFKLDEFPQLINVFIDSVSFKISLFFLSSESTSSKETDAALVRRMNP